MGIKVIAFIDLLGTKESSKVPTDTFQDAIDLFKNTLFTHSKKITDIKIHGFSDCAFLEFCITPESIVFLNRLRSSLFAESYYFKCSIIEGSLEVENEPQVGGNKTFITFGKNSVNAYLTHENYKGLGYVFDDKVINTFLKGETVISAFLEKNNQYKKYYDLKYNESYVGNKEYYSEIKLNNGVEPSKVNERAEKNLNVFLKDFLMAKTKDKRYAKYYISTMIALVNSSDFSSINYLTKTNMWENIPILFYKLFLDKNFDKRIATIAGSEIIYWAAINHYLDSLDIASKKDIMDDMVIQKISDHISKKQKIKNYISNVPTFILTPEHKEIFIKVLASLELSK